MEPTNLVVDLSPVLQLTIELLGAVVLALAGWAVTKFGKKLGLENDAKIRQYLDEAIKNGVAFAEQKLKEQAGKIDEVDVKNAKVAEAANYVIKAVPDAIKHFGVTPEKLADLVTARLK